MGTYTRSRIVSVTLLVLLGMTICSATRAILFPHPYGGYGGGYDGYRGGYGGYGGPFYPGFGGSYGGIKDVHENQAGGVHGKHNIDFGYGNKVFGEGEEEKGHDYGIGEGTGFDAGSHEEEKGGQFGGPGFGGECGHNPDKVKSGSTP